MDWSSILSVLVALVIFIALPLVLRKRKKGSAESMEEFYRHLQEVGVQASLAERGSNREKEGLGRGAGQKSEGIIELEDRNIDSINVVSSSSQYGTQYFIDYLVKSPNIKGERILKKTKAIGKKSPPLWGNVVAIQWKGDESLSRSLNFDYSLEDKLLRSDAKGFKGSISIFPESKHGYTRIRTAYFLPSAEVFGAISSIARYVRSW